MGDILFRNLALLDAENGEIRSGCQVLVRDRLIVEIAQGSLTAPKARIVDLGGRTLMPGLIDCHVHVTAMGRKIPRGTLLPSYVHAHAAENLRGILMRGFTTVRDACGADLGHKQSVEQGLIVGPRLFVAGRGISQTGGHGDSRLRGDQTPVCSCSFFLGHDLARVADGLDEVRQAVRDEIRMGADQIKVMASGGVGSASDPIDYIQYSLEEIEAAVDEAARSHTYVMAHAYTNEAISRAVQAGVRTIEHGNLLDDEGAKLMAERGAFLVPTLICYHIHQRIGRELGFEPESLEKSLQVFTAGTRSLELAKRYGVSMAYGSDLFNSPLEFQSEEFLVRAAVLSPAEIIRSATIVGAEVVRMVGKIGVIAPGAHADLLAVDGNPLEDLAVLQNQGKHMSMIMKDGVFYKNTLS